MQALSYILDRLLSRYKNRVMNVQTLTEAMKKQGLIQSISDIENDHIAFRTLGVAHLGIASLEKIWCHHGYVKKDNYHFTEKKLNAYWYAPPQDNLPRLFISELSVPDLSKTAQDIIYSYTQSITADPLDSLDLDDATSVDHFLHQPCWETPSWQDYTTLLQESDYAAWVIYNRYYLNHFTIAIHNLAEGYNNLENFNAYVESLGIKLNNANGKIKISADGKLKQSSTIAEKGLATFKDGDQHHIAGSYVEFAERLPLDQFSHLAPHQLKRQHRRDGFETANANSIFESTYHSQIDPLS